MSLIMAATSNARTCICSCFFTNNIFINKYKLHVSYTEKSQFMKDYSRILRNRGCVTEKQFNDVIQEIETEVARRRQLGAASLQRRKDILKNYVPLHKDVYHLQEESDLDPQFVSLVSAAKKKESIGTLLEYMDCLGQEIYTFPVFTEEYCQRLMEELDHIELSDCAKGRPNTMNQYGVLLNEFNFNPGVLNRLRLDYLQPITSILYPTWGGRSLDSHKAFTVLYQPDLDRELSCHFDNAEVTLNVAVGSDHFTGGDLFFLSWPGNVDETQQKPVMKYQHRLGWGVLHRGLHQHGAEAVTSGRRCNLIMWMRSSSVRNSRCPMCGEAPHLVEVPGLDDGFTRPHTRVVDLCSTA